MKHGSSTPARRSTARTVTTARRGGRPGLAAAIGAVGVLLAVALCGCGIRDTSLPVDAGDAASRTACPPAPDATLSRPTNEKNALPRESDPAVLVSALESALVSVKRGADGVPLWPAESARPTPTPEAAGPVVSPSASPSAAPSATESDGTLVCLHATAATTGGTGSGSVPGSAPTSAAAPSP